MREKAEIIKERILDFIKQNPGCSSQQILNGLSLEMGTTTMKRYLQDLIQQEFVVPTGKNKARRYSISLSYDVLRSIDVDEYFAKEIDERVIQSTYNSQLINKTLRKIALFTTPEIETLNKLLHVFKSNTSKLSKEEYNNEMERLAIDLSWKSSQIEGNTYTLLETELLLKEKQTASGRTKDEATMLLNHKEALDFIFSQPNYIHPLSISRIEDIHSLLVKDLNISRNIRNTRVGISGTNYKPLDNEFQIREALEDMCELINSKTNVFEKALLALVLISYIQPFSDGNKRTARIISNAILINNHYCPISFRTVDSIEYKKAMLIFYEQNNINPFKKVFMDQFNFAVNTYF
jgi:Fic family protein/predicted transcriptional regulator